MLLFSFSFRGHGLVLEMFGALKDNPHGSELVCLDMTNGNEKNALYSSVTNDQTNKSIYLATRNDGIKWRRLWNWCMQRFPIWNWEFNFQSTFPSNSYFFVPSFLNTPRSEISECPVVLNATSQFSSVNDKHWCDVSTCIKCQEARVVQNSPQR